MMQEDIYNYVLQLADNSLIMGHRLSEWTGYGPELEQDIAVTNIALDLIGQSRYFYQYATLLKDDGSTEDSLAYLRDANEFKNVLLVELPNGDWAKTILKIFFFSTYQYFFYEKLVGSANQQLAAIAEKSLKEVTYHLRWSNEWVIRLGDGTDESHQRMLNALDELWSYTGELFIAENYELQAANNKTGVDVSALKNDWDKKVREVFEEATLPFPGTRWMQSGGKHGIHTEHLGFILAEMQFLQRAYPGCEW
jgi:ring-1,2-phenylacetyl-CoA epoxidase subunit PaaC